MNDFHGGGNESCVGDGGGSGLSSSKGSLFTVIITFLRSFCFVSVCVGDDIGVGGSGVGVGRDAILAVILLEFCAY